MSFVILHFVNGLPADSASVLTNAGGFPAFFTDFAEGFRSSQRGVSPDPEVMMSPGEGLANASAVASTLQRLYKRHAALSPGEAKRLAEYIPRPPRFSLRGRTRGEERRLSTDTQGLVPLEDEVEIALVVKEEAVCARGDVHGGCGGVYRDAHGKGSGYAATSNNASRGNRVPLLESV